MPNTIDYIHYNPRNYLIYGLNRRGEGKEYGSGAVKSEAIRAFSKQKSDILSKAYLTRHSEKQKQEIENMLNFFFSDNDESLNSIDNQYLEELLKNFISEENPAAVARIVARAGEIMKLEDPEVKSFLSKEKSKFANANLNKIEESNTYLNTLESKIILLFDALKFFSMKIKTDEDKLKYKDCENKINQIMNVYKEVLKVNGMMESQIPKNVKSIKMRVNKRKNQGNSKGRLYTQDQLKVNINNNEYNLITLINDMLVDRSLFPIEYFNKEQGLYFELAIAGLAALANNKAKEEVEKIIRESVTYFDEKTKRNSIVDFEKGFSDRIPQDIILKNTEQTGRTRVGTLGIQPSIPTSSKLDVTITQNGQLEKISAKNVNIFLTGDIHLVTDTSMAYLLQDEGSAFVNHYLNVIAQNNLGIPNPSEFTILRLSAFYAAAATFIYKAFSGDVKNRKDQIAELFIINNNSKNFKGKRIKVYDINELMIRLFNFIDATKNFRIKVNGKTDLKDFTMLNEQQNTKNSVGTPMIIDNIVTGATNKQAANLRVGKFQAELVTTKLKVAIPKSALKQDFK